MRTPRTAEETASIISDGLGTSLPPEWVQVIAPLLAEHEAAIAELREQLPKLPPGEWTRESVAAFNAARCESGEEGRMAVALNASTNAAASAQRAPDSIVPTAEEVAADTAVLCSRRPNLARSRRKLMAMHLNALAADRDHWREARRASDEAARVEIDRLKRELAASDRALVNECNRLEAARDRSMALWERSYLLCEKVMAERDALQRRIDAVAQIVRFFAEDDGTDPIVGKVKDLHDCHREQSNKLIALQDRIDEMARREPTEAEYAEMRRSGSCQGVWRYVRGQLLATPASEPSEGPKCDHHQRAWIGKIGEPGGQICSGCGLEMPHAETVSTPQPTPATDGEAAVPGPGSLYERLSPATPSAETVEEWHTLISRCGVQSYWKLAQAIAAEVARREAGLRTERDTFERHADEYRKQRDGARAAFAAASAALESLRPALQAANEDNLRLLKLLDEAKRRSVS